MNAPRRIRWTAGFVVLGHALVSGGHGVAHALVPVGLDAWQWAVVLVAAVVGPLVALWLVWQGSYRMGGLVLAGAMATALAFGVVFHYLLPNPDHVSMVVGQWAAPFAWTASGVAVLELAGLIFGLWLIRWPREGAIGSVR